MELFPSHPPLSKAGKRASAILRFYKKVSPELSGHPLAERSNRRSKAKDDDKA